MEINNILEVKAKYLTGELFTYHSKKTDKDVSTVRTSWTRDGKAIIMFDFSSSLLVPEDIAGLELGKEYTLLCDIQSSFDKKSLNLVLCGIKKPAKI